MPKRVRPESFLICMSRPNATLVNGTEGCDAEAKTQLTSLVYVDYHDLGCEYQYWIYKIRFIFA